MKITTVIGARPQFIKASALSRAIREYPDIHETIVHTGQHYDPNMSDVFFEELEVPAPAHHLGIGGKTHGAQTGQMLEAIERLLLEDRPDYLLVYGDTDSTLAGALAASKLLIPVVHVEAGLRSRNMAMPEEQNRIVTDHLASRLFTPTLESSENLIKEGISSARIKQVGDIMFDVAIWARGRAASTVDVLSRYRVAEKEYAVVTCHRAENTDDPERLRNIMNGLNEIADSHLPVLLPLHPRTIKRMEENSIPVPDSSNLQIVEPLGYLEFAQLVARSKVVITDSGGLQKEAFFHSVPCVTLRDETEWTELVECGANRLVDVSVSGALVAAVESAGDSEVVERPLYGNGKTAEAILDSLSD